MHIGGISMLKDIKEYDSLYIDGLTGLKDFRGLFFDYDDVDLQALHFIYVDIDDFKRMNAVFGIDSVDSILIQVAQRLKKYCGHSNAYRIGPGSFLLVTNSQLICAPDHLGHLFDEPIRYEHLQILVSSSICVLDHEDFLQMDMNEVLKLLRFSLDQQKRKNPARGLIVHVEKEDLEEFFTKKEIANSLYDGLKKGEFYSKYQPFVDTFTNEIVGFEAVARWDLNGEMLRPHTFLEAAEWTGLIYDIELQIFKDSVQFYKELVNRRKELNLSNKFKAAIHFSDYTLKRINVSQLKTILEEFDVEANNFIIETHERFMSQKDSYNQVKLLHQAGFMVALDEYSNDNSSLSFLADLQVDIIKLSESLMHNLNTDEEYNKLSSLYQFMVDIAKKFNLAVVSDGIENKKDLKFVQKIGVNVGQGKYFSRAILKEEFVEFLTNNKQKR